MQTATITLSTQHPLEIPGFDTALATHAQRVLAYENENLLERIMDKEGLSEEAARILMRDMLQFLMIAGAFRGQPLAPTPTIDAAWHHFILFTHDYAAFCQDHFGRFIHHVPNTKSRLHLVGNGMLSRSIQKAKEIFGPLSPNWTGRSADDPASCVSDCEKCNGHSNCQN